MFGLGGKKAEEGQRVVTWRPMLRARPHQNRASDLEEMEDGSLRVTGTLRKPWWLGPPLTWVLKTRPQRTWALPTLGAEIWKLCDGTRRVEDVVAEFAGRHGLTFHESRLLVTNYMRTLVERGLLGVVPEEETEGAKEEGRREKGEGRGGK